MAGLLGWRILATSSIITELLPIATCLPAMYAVLVPAWRGENGNPGEFEMCFGEVDDAVAAAEYLARRPDVDRNRIFGFGHSVGATTIMLAAETSKRLRAADVLRSGRLRRGLLHEPDQTVLPATRTDSAALKFLRLDHLSFRE